MAICPHATIRAKVYEPAALKGAPAAFKSVDSRVPDFKGWKFTLQVAAEDCTGCALCVDVCPAKNKTEVKLKAINMRPQAPLREQERKNWDFFLALPEVDRRKVKVTQLRQQQLMRPLFEFSGACAGCGETPYVKLLSQLFGDRAVIGNATGCSSIYGGNLPTTPYAVDQSGRGPTWCNSLFEDNAEFGLGFRVSIDKQKEFATELVKKLAPQLGDDLVTGVVNAGQTDEAGIYEQRGRVAALKQKLAKLDSPEAKALQPIADTLVRKSVWILGGDGWAYDIGYGGLDHVLASGRDVNVLVLDTEVYSNTGGQMSKSTPRGAVAKFAAGGKPLGKKDLGLIAMTLRQHLRGQRGHGRQGRADAPRVHRGGILSTDRRSSSPTAIASRTASRWTRASAPGSRSSRSNPASGCCTATTRAGPRRGENPLQLDSGGGQGQGAGLPAVGKPVQDAHQEQAGGRQEILCPGPGGRRPALEVLPVSGRPRSEVRRHPGPGAQTGRHRGPTTVTHAP